jgi:hypothetical protein
MSAVEMSLLYFFIMRTIAFGMEASMCGDVEEACSRVYPHVGMETCRRGCLGMGMEA